MRPILLLFLKRQSQRRIQQSKLVVKMLKLVKLENGCPDGNVMQLYQDSTFDPHTKLSSFRGVIIDRIMNEHSYLVILCQPH